MSIENVPHPIKVRRTLMLHRDREVSPTQREQESRAPKADKYRNGVMKYPQTAD